MEVDTQKCQVALIFLDQIEIFLFQSSSSFSLFVSRIDSPKLF